MVSIGEHTENDREPDSVAAVGRRNAADANCQIGGRRKTAPHQHSRALGICPSEPACPPHWQRVAEHPRAYLYDTINLVAALGISARIQQRARQSDASSAKFVSRAPLAVSAARIRGAVKTATSDCASSAGGAPPALIAGWK